MNEQKYLVSYERKEQDGNFIYTKTETKILSKTELNNLVESSRYFYSGYLKILFCQNLSSNEQEADNEQRD